MKIKITQSDTEHKGKLLYEFKCPECHRMAKLIDVNALILGDLIMHIGPGTCGAFYQLDDCSSDNRDDWEWSFWGIE